MAAMATLAAQYVPSTAVLGQWTGLRSIGGMCRWRGPNESKVALTFDDGPSPAITPKILDALDRLGWRATFFCLGSLVEQEPNLVAEIVQRGHDVGTHGYDHAHHFARSPAWIVRDLHASVDALKTCGVEPRYYRPTFGQLTGTTMAAALWLGLEIVLWSAWGREWTTDDHRKVADLVSSRLDDGAIVLLHDNDAFGPIGMADVALAALEPIAESVSRRGLQPATLAELFAGRATEVRP
jgi:peptidoglycan/xylan/chitin deacetylase (PgdA/CDA1 family)